jgi:hypothetical protein
MHGGVLTMLSGVGWAHPGPADADGCHIDRGDTHCHGLPSSGVRPVLETRVLRHADIADGRPVDILEGFYHSYETAHGFTLNVGDRLTLSTPLGSSASITAVGGGGGAYGGGVGVVRGSSVGSVYYTTVYNGTQSATMAKAVMLALAGNVDPSLYMAPLSLAGAEVQVARMRLGGTKKRPSVWAECELVNSGEKANTSGIITVGDVDVAIRLGEVSSPKYITREIAIARLREAHDLLDLEVYTQQQYDAEKAKYLPYIQPTPPSAAPTAESPLPPAVSEPAPQ